jgi:hypothetical protein
MKTETVTNGQLADLLVSLGFTRKSRDDHYDVYSEPTTDMWFPLPKADRHAPARTSHLDALRAQLSYRGLMTEGEFDAHFADGAALRST